MTDPLRELQSQLFDLPIGNSVEYSRGYSAAIARVNEQVAEMLAAPAPAPAPDATYREECGCVGDGTQTLLLCDHHAGIAPAPAPALGGILWKYHATHLPPCTAANPEMDCTCGLNDLLAAPAPAPALDRRDADDPYPNESRQSLIHRIELLTADLAAERDKTHALHGYAMYKRDAAPAPAPALEGRGDPENPYHKGTDSWITFEQGVLAAKQAPAPALDRDRLARALEVARPAIEQAATTGLRYRDVHDDRYCARDAHGCGCLCHAVDAIADAYEAAP